MAGVRALGFYRSPVHYPHGAVAAMPLDSGDSVEVALDVADFQAETTMLRYSHDEVFSSLRDGLSGA